MSILIYFVLCVTLGAVDIIPTQGSKIIDVALATPAPALSGIGSVFFCIFMTFTTMSYSTLYASPSATKNVDSLSYYFQMTRPDTSVIETQVVRNKRLYGYSDKEVVSTTLFAIKRERAIAISKLTCKPYPTISKLWTMCWNRTVLINSRPESFFNGLISSSPRKLASTHNPIILLKLVSEFY